MKYETESEIVSIVRRFETGTISRDEWRHAEHLTVALYYILHSESLSDATNKMRSGIFNLLTSFGVDLSKEMPYHETLTGFWMRAVYEFTENKNDVSAVELINGAIKSLGDKDLPLKFYRRELLFSERARAAFVEPDLLNFRGAFR